MPIESAYYPYTSSSTHQKCFCIPEISLAYFSCSSPTIAVVLVLNLILIVIIMSDVFEEIG